MRNKLRLFFWGYGFALLISGDVLAASMNLTGIIRDFKAYGETGGHPDFENGCCGLVTGMVAETLGADGTPEYMGGGFTSGVANFYDWYHDTPNNLSTSYTISLDNGLPGPGGVYSYSNNAFFPIDGQLFGDYALGHNYHFTYQLHGIFTYQLGQVFSFSGDDDVWAFIDKTLVVDLGGVHGPESGSVDLDSLGLIAGNDYDFDFFFAERHTAGSNFTMQTSILVEQSPEIPEPGLLALLGMGLLILKRCLGNR